LPRCLAEPLHTSHRRAARHLWRQALNDAGASVSRRARAPTQQCVTANALFSINLVCCFSYFKILILKFSRIPGDRFSAGCCYGGQSRGYSWTLRHPRLRQPDLAYYGPLASHYGRIACAERSSRFSAVPRANPKFRQFWSRNGSETAKKRLERRPSFGQGHGQRFS
jgi:hypothetical protein